VLPESDEFWWSWLSAVCPKVRETPTKPTDHFDRCTVCNENLWCRDRPSEGIFAALNRLAISRGRFESRVKPFGKRP
jgi:hypothetical protein